MLNRKIIGNDTPTLDVAIAEGIRTIQAILAERRRHDLQSTAGSLQIRDSDGNVMTVLSYSDYA